MRFIAGSGRSGTTWVQDALAAANGLRPIFEPLHPYVSKVGNRYAHKALTRHDDEPALKEFFDQIRVDRSHRLWTHYRQQMRWLFPPPSEFCSYTDAGRVWRRWKKFAQDAPRLMLATRAAEPIVKCIRANLMLDWLTGRAGYRVVLIVRHPGAVIESELRGGWNAKFALDRFRNDDKLRAITHDRYRSLLERTGNDLEALTLRWIIENQWVTEQAPKNNVSVVYYERLKAEPESEWAAIVKALALPNSPPARIIGKPSQQSSPNRSAISESTSIPRWQRALNREQIDTVQRILDLAGCDLYSMSDPEPRIPQALVHRDPKTITAS